MLGVRCCGVAVLWLWLGGLCCVRGVGCMRCDCGCVAVWLCGCVAVWLCCGYCPVL